MTHLHLSTYGGTEPEVDTLYRYAGKVGETLVEALDAALDPITGPKGSAKAWSVCPFCMTTLVPWPRPDCYAHRRRFGALGYVCGDCHDLMWEAQYTAEVEEGKR